jgi:hypothetical protein
MTTNWNLTSSLVADRRSARESAAQRHRLLNEGRGGHHRFHRRRPAAVESASRSGPLSTTTAPTPTPTTTATTTTAGPTPRRAAA